MKTTSHTWTSARAAPRRLSTASGARRRVCDADGVAAVSARPGAARPSRAAQRLAHHRVRWAAAARRRRATGGRRNFASRKTSIFQARRVRPQSRRSKRVDALSIALGMGFRTRPGRAKTVGLAGLGTACPGLPNTARSVGRITCVALVAIFWADAEVGAKIAMFWDFLLSAGTSGHAAAPALSEHLFAPAQQLAPRDLAENTLRTGAKNAPSA